MLATYKQQRLTLPYCQTRGELSAMEFKLVQLNVFLFFIVLNEIKRNSNMAIFLMLVRYV